MCAKIISIEQAIEMKNEYKTHIKPLIENYRGNGYKATEFTWIDMKTLKDYVQKLNDVKTKNGKEISGIRIYFGAHPKITSVDTNTEDMFSERESIFLVPTVEVSTTNSSNYPNLHHLPFCINPDNSSDSLKGSFEIIEDLLNSKDETTGNGTSNYSNKTSLIMDDMSLTPPPG